jgi:hypothetical protein
MLKLKLLTQIKKHKIESNAMEPALIHEKSQSKADKVEVSSPCTVWHCGGIKMLEKAMDYMY